MLKFGKNREKGNKNAPGAKPESRSASNPQAITARGSALTRLALIALLIVAVPACLAFGYLILLREPAMQQQQLARVSAALASQQATNIGFMFTRLRERVTSAAQSAPALAAVAGQSDREIALLEEALRAHFPEVESLRVVPFGEMGTAVLESGDQGLRNHIEVDLVRRSGKGDATQPEAYQFQNRWLTSMATLVTHPDVPDRRAIILVTLDNERVSEQLRSLDTSTGRFTLEQSYTNASGAQSTNMVAAAGSGDAREFARRADVPDTPWQVAFTPSRALASSLSPDPVPLYVTLAVVLLSSVIALVVLVKRFGRTLDAEVNKIISAAERKAPLELVVPELVSVAKQLRRATLRALRQSGAAATFDMPRAEVEEVDHPVSELTDPMFQSTSILDEDEDELELDLELSAEDAGSVTLQAGEGFPEHIFRAYDIRGNAETELTDELVGGIGRAIGSVAADLDEQTLIVGCDGRSSSPRIKSALIRALMETGRDVIDIGMVPTPLLYFATRHLNCRSGVMVTGSHNPGQDNGLKIVLNQQTIAAGGIRRIRDRVVEGNFVRGNGRMIREDVVEAYRDEVINDIAIAVPLKIVIDAGNGAAGTIAPDLFEELGCEVIPLYCDVDGSFPNHPPDTSNEDNLADLAMVVRERGADFGVAFDGDGDRLAVVTGSGRIVRSDLLLMIFAEDVVSRNPGADVVFDVKCTRNLTRLITRHGGRPVLWKTGHAFMKEKMAETGALLGGEFSGHIFFGERWYGFDDGMYAAGRLAEILSTHGDSLDEVLEGFPETFNTPEIIIPVPEAHKFELIQKIVANADFASGKVNTLDGIRVDFTEGWGLLRASNTSPALTARFEANSEESLASIKEEFRELIARADPDLQPNF